MSDIHTRAVERLERQFLTADQLMLVLAAVAADHQRDSIRWDDLEIRDRIKVSHAMSSALRLAVTWVNVHSGELTTRLGRFAAADAVAANDLTEVLPELAASLAEAWQLALKVREDLRALGPNAEAVALRIAPSWRADLGELATAVAAVTLVPDTGPGQQPRSEPPLAPPDSNEPRHAR